MVWEIIIRFFLKFKRIIIEILILVVLLLSIFILYKMYTHQVNENRKWQENYKSLTFENTNTLDALGRSQLMIRDLQMTRKELKSELFQKNKVFSELRKELQYSDVKLKNLEKVLWVQMNAKDTGITIIRDTIFVNKIGKYDYFSIQDSNLIFEAWWQEKDSVDWYYHYTEDILYWIEKKPTLYNNLGEKRFFLWKWLFPKKQSKVYIKSTNKNSQLNVIDINVE